MGWREHFLVGTMNDSDSDRITLLLVRHGARYDFANKKAWKDRCVLHGHESSDPPLSALGHQQARETAIALTREQPDVIYSSPYFRVLQTAQPLAHALGLPICIEHCLAEFGHHPMKIPTPAMRVPHIPEVDETYVPLLERACRGIDATGAEPTVDYLRRLLLWKQDLASGRHTGKTMVCFSHAASVALVGALTGCATLADAGRFAPCGIWKLVSHDGGHTWNVVARGDDNTAHCTANVRQAQPHSQSTWRVAEPTRSPATSPCPGSNHLPMGLCECVVGGALLARGPRPRAHTAGPHRERGTPSTWCARGSARACGCGGVAPACQAVTKTERLAQGHACARASRACHRPIYRRLSDSLRRAARHTRQRTVDTY